MLPARVEAAIAARLGRLSPEQRDLLKVVSVEGETFTAQVIAEVQGLRERAVLQMLNHDLGVRYRLVHEVEEVRVDGQYLSRYKFAHALFQDYLYRELSNGERRLLHGEVAMALEAAYGENVDSIAALLAFHYDQAGQVDKAIEYMLLAGEQARLAYANEDAIGYLEQVLALLDDGTPGNEGKQWQYEALCELGKIYFHMGRITEAEKLLREAITRGKEIGVDPLELVRLYYWLGETVFW